MTITYSTPDTFAPAVAVFTCRCGRQATSSGATTGSPPPGWIESGAGRHEHFCPACAGRYSEAFARSK